MNFYHKYNSNEVAKYWLTLHQKERNDLKAVIFPNHTLYLNKFFDEMQKFVILRALSYLDISCENKKMLDIGCGRGRWLGFYKSLGAIPLGLDLSKDAVNICKKKNFKAIVGDCRHLPFNDSSFDVVNSVAVLLHLTFEDQKIAAKEIMRILKPGGLLILLECTRNDSSPHVFCRSEESWQDIFRDLNSVFLEAHYFCPLLRLFWKIPFLGNIDWLENLIVALQKPWEKLFLSRNFSRQNKKALQHLMIFLKK